MQPSNLDSESAATKQYKGILRMPGISLGIFAQGVDTA